MPKADQYREILPTLDEWEPYLLAHSGLPGPRGNLELLQVVAVFQGKCDSKTNSKGVFISSAK